MPDIKHVGEGAKTHHLWRAQDAGFDDAVFVDRAGRLSEATIWNLAVLDGDTVLWPDAPRLAGTTMQILQRRLRDMGVAQATRPLRPADVAGHATVVMNSWTPAVPVSRIGEHPTAAPEPLIARLREVWDAEPAVRV